MSVGRIATQLALAEILVWAGTYYLFPALLPVWERDLGWSKAELSGAFTLSLLLSAGGAPLVGRLIDRGYGRAVFTGSALLAAAMLVALAGVTSRWQFYAAWAALGLAMAGALYEACFAVLTRYLGDQARRAITRVALIAGFAGTLSFPSAQYLSALFDWRVTALVFALVLAAVASPLIFAACTLARTGAGPDVHQVHTAGPPPAGLLRTPVFWLLGTAFACVGLDHGMLLTHLLPLLADKGLAATTAVLAAACIGPMQVVGRVLMLSAERHVSTPVLAAVSLALMAVAALVLLAAGAGGGLVFLFVALHGAGYGVTSIVRPVVTAEFLGRRHFGVVSGMLALLFMGAFAVAPSAAALLWRLGGYDLVTAAAAAIALLGLGCIGIAVRHVRRQAT